MNPLLSNLVSASAMDVIVTRCRHGEKGIADIFDTVLQNCIIEKNAAQDSPKKPVHHRYRSQSSFLSSETTLSPRPGATYQPGLDPEALESWKKILAHIDKLLCHSVDNNALLDTAKGLGDPLETTASSFVALKALMQSTVHAERMVGMKWIRDHSMAKLEQCLLQEDRCYMVHRFSQTVPKDLPFLSLSYQSRWMLSSWKRTEALKTPMRCPVCSMHGCRCRRRSWALRCLRSWRAWCRDLSPIHSAPMLSRICQLGPSFVVSDPFCSGLYTQACNGFVSCLQLPGRNPHCESLEWCPVGGVHCCP